MARLERRELIRRIEKKRGSQLVCLLTTDRENVPGLLTKDAMPYFNERLRCMGSVDQVDVFIVTQGGDTLAGFGLSRLVRERAPRFAALAPEKCHSAGTLFALGANEIVMLQGATLSPFDPSIIRPLNPAVEMQAGAPRQLVPLSVESVAGFLALVKDEWGLKSEEALTAAFRLLAERVNPLALGDVFRARQQIERLARTLLEQHSADSKQHTKIIKTLTRDLGSHDYLISRTEAKQILGAQVVDADSGLELLLWDLFRDFAKDMELGVLYQPRIALHAAEAAGQSSPVAVVLKQVVIESASGGHVFEQEHRIARQAQQPGLPPGFPGLPPMMAQPPSAGGVEDAMVRIGWASYD
jgi:hypothetical protein